MSNFNEKLWHGTRRYMISGRTNPPPAEYIRTLESLYMTMGERVELIRRVGQFPGGDQALKTATIQDIMKAKVLP